ncbi:MAG: BlaI/MecI/CopY family transcriptional regulator [Peptostreptococcaceae bacterium]|nr:BlaI/MecI/CopY family transcriptional regulator [Peptostreptococcaceae bacterium]
MKNNTKRLPDAEFTVMKAIWHSEAPITTHTIMEHLSSDITWKPQTLLTMLARLTEKGFLSSQRVGRERCYTPIITEKEYLDIETGNFLQRYAGNSIGKLVKTLYAEGDMSAEDLDELREWLERKGSE